MDFDPKSVDETRTSPLGKLFDDANFISGKESTSHNWGKGHYAYGALLDDLLNRGRKEMEKCDSFEGCQIMHSISSGTGGGFTTAALPRLEEELEKPFFDCYCLFPSPTRYQHILDPYNAILSLHYLIEYAYSCTIFQNEAISSICKRSLAAQDSQYDDFNYIIASLISNITAGNRFPCELDWNLKKLTNNIIPYPRLHFFVPTMAPFSSKALSKPQPWGVRELTDELFSNENALYCFHEKNSKRLGTAVLYRGNLPTYEVLKVLKSYKEKTKDQYHDWIVDPYFTGICEVAPLGLEWGGCSLILGQQVCHIIKELTERFTVMFRRKAFLQYYTGEGMDEMEFIEAESNANDLCSEFDPYVAPSSEDSDEDY